jgi:hypothetical protein
MKPTRKDTSTFERAKQEFEEAWSNPDFTCFDLPPIDVNRVLSERYEVEPAGAKITLTQVWDMETKKAWSPAIYIPYVVSRGRSWGRHALEVACERFYRTSEQAAWIDPSRGEVIEEVSISHREKRIFFLGRSYMVDAWGQTIRAGDFQPMFHVEHAAAGSEERPLNIWRIVVLTEREDDRFKKPFEDMIAAGFLPGFLEEYMRRDLGWRIARRDR